MPDVRKVGSGTVTSRGRFKTSRKYTLDGATYRKEFIQRIGESKKAVIDRANEWQALNRGKRIAALRSLGGCIGLYMEYREGDDVTPETLAEDRYTARLLTESLGSCEIKSLDPFGVEIALRKWQDKPRTAKKVRDFGRRVYKWLGKRGWAERNPFAESKPVPYQPVTWEEPMPAQDFERAIAYVADDVVRALILLLRHTGIRPISARRLLWSEIKELHGRTVVQKLSAKTRAGTAPMFVPDVAASALLSLPKKSLLVFPSKATGREMCKSHIGRIWKKAQIAAGLEPRNVYDLKHLCVTERLDALGDDSLVAASVGVQSTEVINRNYRQIDRKSLIERLEKIRR